jgi:hypothetical protein
MTDPAKHDDDIDAEDVLELFNAEDIAERPGEPPRSKGTPADDADAPAPG